jgi:hypothetical protein
MQNRRGVESGKKRKPKKKHEKLMHTSLASSLSCTSFGSDWLSNRESTSLFLIVSTTTHNEK